VQVLGRRPSQRVDGFVIPASKNLHPSGLMRRSKQRNYSITDHLIRAGETQRGL
jgi:hypothetical protein